MDRDGARLNLVCRNCRSAGLLIRTRSPAQRCSLRPMTLQFVTGAELFAVGGQAQL